MKRFFRELLSDKGYISSKRVFGGLIIICVLFVLIYLTIKSGCSDCVKDLAEMSLLISATLLGVSNITNIWKGKGGKTPPPTDTTKQE